MKIMQTVPENKLGLIFHPRPLVLITTADQNSVFNVAPYSFIGPISVSPPLNSVSMKPTQKTYQNVMTTKKLCINFVGKRLAEKAVACEQKFEGQNKFETLGLSFTLSDKFRLPIFKESSLILECTFKQELTDISDSHRIIITQIEAAYQNSRNDFVFQLEWDTFTVLGESLKVERTRKTIKD
jgi:flavin reductase (DIM6/NTAB) family NADH-FMN oxidoreductase RutF